MAEINYTPRPAPGADTGADTGTDPGSDDATLAALTRLQTQESDILARRSTEMDKARAGAEGATEQLTKTGGAALNRYRSQTQDIEKFKPEDTRKASMDWMMIAAAFGSIAGAFSRYHTTTALNAFAGAMSGWAQGDLVKFNQQYKTWEANAEAATRNNDKALREYELIMGNAKLNLDAKMTQMQMVASKYQDELMASAAQQKNFTQVAQIMQKKTELGVRMATLNETIQYHHAELQQKTDEARQKAEQSDPFVMAQKLDAIQDPKQRARAEKMIQTLHPQGALLFGEPGQGDEPTSGGALTSDAIEQRAQLMASGNVMDAMRGVGGGVASSRLRNLISNRAAEIAKDNGTDLPTAIQQYKAQSAGATSYQRSSATMAARVENASNEVAQLLPQALETSRALPRTKWVRWNELQQAYQQGTSDLAYNDFALANFSLVNAYTRAMNPQGVPRITERLEQHANGILSTATDQASYEVQLRRLWKEVQASKAATVETRQGTTALGAFPGDNPASRTTPAGSQKPAAGQVEDGYRFKGGDPAKRENWEMVTPPAGAGVM